MNTSIESRGRAKNMNVPNDTGNATVSVLPRLERETDKSRSVEQVLLARKLISGADLGHIKDAERQSGLGTIKIIYSLGLVAERELARIVAETHDLPLVSDNEFMSYFADGGQLSSRFLKQATVCPIAESEDEVRLAMADPADHYIIKAIGMACRKKVVVCVATPSQIERALERLFDNTDSSLSEIVEAIDDESGASGDINVERLIDLASETPVVRLVNIIISRAVEMRASDIHIEPFDKALKVRYRIDGVLINVDAPPARSAAAVISRLKIMAKLNIAERRLPQDGRIQIRSQGKTIDLRVSTVPTLHGESVVLRILDKEELPLDFTSLGFTGPTARAFNELLDQPHGIVLVTGPTGSGKTTTQYAALHRLNVPQRKILTVEDPVEYQLEGINQIQVKPSIDLTFANALRSIVRQDPDVIMIGEMRDLETASIAVQSALTGHLVLSTLHTNDAGSSITRLLDMGVKDYLLTSTVNGVIAQRLVRTLCAKCRQSYIPLPDLRTELGLDLIATHSDIKLYKAVGCDQCAHTGYRGRTVICELLKMTDRIRSLVLSHADSTTTQQAAIEQGMKTLKHDGLTKALDGVTTIEEVVRVTQSG